MSTAVLTMKPPYNVVPLTPRTIRRFMAERMGELNAANPVLTLQATQVLAAELRPLARTIQHRVDREPQTWMLGFPLSCTLCNGTGFISRLSDQGQQYLDANVRGRPEGNDPAQLRLIIRDLLRHNAYSVREGTCMRCKGEGSFLTDSLVPVLIPVIVTALHKHKFTAQSWPVWDLEDYALPLFEASIFGMDWLMQF